MPADVSWEITVERLDGSRLPPRLEVRRGPPLKGQKIQVKDDQGNTISAEIVHYTYHPPQGPGSGPYQITVRELAD
jgi:hypothetical protein